MGKTSRGLKSVVAALKSRSAVSFYILFSLLGFCALFYYFGELVIFFGWEALRWEFFYSVHDFHRLLFLAPIIYAGYVFGIKATLIISILSIMIFLPRAFFISPYPDPLIRMMLFSGIAVALGLLTAVNRREILRRRRAEAQLNNERQKLQGILERMADGVIIIGPDYKVRFTNPKMAQDFGEGIGITCHSYLHQRDTPCGGSCRLPAVLNGATERWEYVFPAGRTYEIMASPYIDADGKTCQLAIFRDISHRRK